MKKTNKLLSIILAILMIVTTIPMAFAAESDGIKTTLDISKGKIIIADSYVTLGNETVEVDPDGYIVTGKARGDTPLKFINNSGSSITFDLVFDDLSLTADAWCSVITIEDNSPITLNIVCEGSNAISSYNHPVFNNDRARTSITINITKIEGSSFTFQRREEQEKGILFHINDTNTFVYINGNQLDAAAKCYVHKNIDGIQDCRGYLCDTCGRYFGEKDETKHYGDGVQTCCGYKCEVCGKWYGEAGDEHIDEDEDALCDGCDTFIGEEIKVGDTYTVTKEEYVKFVPAVSGTYILSSSADSDPYVMLYDSDFESITNADDNYGLNFSLEYNYEAGETYYFYFYDYDDEYNYSVSFVCAEHQGGTQTCKGYVCDACGEWYGEADADAHDIVIDEAVAPTCTETGLTEGSHCSHCEDMTVAQEVIPALDHDIVIDQAVAPTCTETGLTEGQHCTRCDAMTVAQEVVPELGHIDADGDYLCDHGCGTQISGGEDGGTGEPEADCACGKEHKNLWDIIVCFVMSIIEIVFGKLLAK